MKHKKIWIAMAVILIAGYYIFDLNSSYDFFVIDRCYQQKDSEGLYNIALNHVDDSSCVCTEAVRRIIQIGDAKSYHYIYKIAIDKRFHVSQFWAHYVQVRKVYNKIDIEFLLYYMKTSTKFLDENDPYHPKEAAMLWVMSRHIPDFHQSNLADATKWFIQTYGHPPRDNPWQSY
jgi:hypothetical protein